MPSRLRRAFSVGVAVLAAFVVLCPRAAAHDIPMDVTAQILAKPDGQHLHMIVRVPLKAMRDIEFPTFGPGFLDIAHTDPQLREAANLWVGKEIEVYEGNTRLPNPQVIATRVSLESDRSFTSYETALAHIHSPRLPDKTEVVWDQVMFDILFDYPIHSDTARFSIHPGLGRLGEHVVIVLRFETPTGAVHAFEFLGDPGVVRIEPHWYQAALRFVNLGFFHILSGTDHLLFLFCLVIPFRKFRGLIPIVTAFTIAHSITLIASAYNLAPNVLWFPPLIEMLIAISIVYMALENIVGVTTVQRRWMVAFGFGLVHGFGFSFALRQTLQFAGTHMLTSLLSFNIGVELGQMLMIALYIPALELLFKYAVAERMGTIILSAIVAHTAWHWMVDRANILSQYRFEWPTVNLMLFATAMRWMMVLVILGGLVWLFRSVLKDRVDFATPRRLWMAMRARRTPPTIE
ncbi:MAG: HupE/UreJ family protein [Candidatus Acidiferrales bacterium]